MRTKGVDKKPPKKDEPPERVAESTLDRLVDLARNNPQMVFTSLAHRIDLHLLEISFKQVRNSKAAGVDKVTAKEYAKSLDQNLYNLYQRLRRGQYVAQPVKRIWIDKEGGKKRPIGITVLEDKIVQKAVYSILEAIYDVDFHDFSHGFRKGHSPHLAHRELRAQCRAQRANWIVNADIKGLFDHIEHELLKEVIKLRVNDGGIIRLIGKWLNAGVLEGESFTKSELGTPQGGVISPMLANIFLHHVLDDWYIREVEPRLKGKSFLIRFADDFIIGCELKTDAYKVMEVLPKRFGRFGLTLNEEKSKLIPFMRPGSKSRKGGGTFNFLGFTIYWGRSREGYWVIKKKTARKRVGRFIRTQRQWCRKNLHKPIRVQHEKLCQKLRGHYQYFGVRGNFKSLQVVYENAKKAWYYGLNRRTRKGKMNEETFRLFLKKYPLCEPRIVHSI